jgi:hypothetical protein
MVSCETYYRRAFAAARAHGRYVGGGLYASMSGELRRVRLYEEWIEDPSRGFLVLV